jgi:hypothetical protein
MTLSKTGERKLVLAHVHNKMVNVDGETSVVERNLLGWCNASCSIDSSNKEQPV